MGFVGALHSLRSFRRRLPWALGPRPSERKYSNAAAYDTVHERLAFTSTVLVIRRCWCHLLVLGYALLNGSEKD